MYGILFRVVAKPGKLQELIAHAEWVVAVCEEKEPGTLRFDFYKDPHNDQAIYVYEAYQDRTAFEAHKQNEPYKRWVSGRAEELTTDFEILFDADAIVSMAAEPHHQKE